jgi:hypothetical protein
MTTPFKHEYAAGVELRQVDERRVLDHNGGIEGFNTHLAYYPDDKLTVIVLSKQNTGATENIVASFAK